MPANSIPTFGPYKSTNTLSKWSFCLIDSQTARRPEFCLKVSLLGGSFVPRGVWQHLKAVFITKGDTTEILWVKAKGASDHSTTHNATPLTMKCLLQSVCGFDPEKPSYNPGLWCPNCSMALGQCHLDSGPHWTFQLQPSRTKASSAPWLASLQLGLSGSGIFLAKSPRLTDSSSASLPALLLNPLARTRDDGC